MYKRQDVHEDHRGERYIVGGGVSRSPLCGGFATVSLGLGGFTELQLLGLNLKQRTRDTPCIEGVWATQGLIPVQNKDTIKTFTSSPTSRGGSLLLLQQLQKKKKKKNKKKKKKKKKNNSWVIYSNPQKCNTSNRTRVQKR